MVCGLRDPENIRAVSLLPIDMIGFDFSPNSLRYVNMIPSHAGIIPDRLGEKAKSSILSNKLKRVGVFVDEMPQSVVTRVYNFHLDYVQLNGDEPVTYIDNLRSTIVPDIRQFFKIIKTIKIDSAEDLKSAEQYEGHADILLFEVNVEKDTREEFVCDVLKCYDGKLPFVLDFSIEPKDAEFVKGLTHTKLLGVNLNTGFEIKPGVISVATLNDFLRAISQ